MNGIIFLGIALLLYAVALLFCFRPYRAAGRVFLCLLAAMGVLAFLESQVSPAFLLMEVCLSVVVASCAFLELRAEAAERAKRTESRRKAKKARAEEARLQVRSRMQEDRVAAGYFGGNPELTYLGRCA